MKPEPIIKPPKDCADCGAELGANALLGLCPRCQLGAVIESGATACESGGAPPLGDERRRFGDYELGRQLGRGGMGVVYEAVHVSLRRSVALKMILDSHGASPASRRRFAIEAEAAARLDHPNIVPIYDVGEYDEQPYFSMKLVQGESLRVKMARGEMGAAANRPAGPSQPGLRERQIAVARLTATVARAIHHAHEHGVLHRDLKPANILIDRDGAPHLTDFGLAKILDLAAVEYPQGPLTASDVVLGTPSYMSPEQARNQRVSAASDVYSLGAVLFELLTGEPPFKGSTALETVRLLTEQEPRRPSSVRCGTDRDLDTICVKCLEKNPESRYGSALALAEDLERWLRREPIQARRAGPMLRLSRWVKRNPVGTGLIVSLFTGLTLALVLLQMALERQHRLDVMRTISVQEFTEKVERLWADPNQTFIDLHHADLAALADLMPREPDPHTLRLVDARSINENPVGQAMRWAPWLKELELKMERILQRPVLFDLRLSKFTQDLDQRVVRGEAVFQKMGALSYLRAKRLEPGLQPVALEVRPREGIIFVRRELGVTNLAQLAGLRLAFAHTNSIISFLGKVHLARAGIAATNLKAYQNLDYGLTLPEWVNRKSPRGELETDPDFDSHAHKEVVKQVLANAFDGGVCLRMHFERNKHRGQGLVELLAYPIPYDVLVAGPGVDPAVVDAFRTCLTSTTSRRERALMRGLASSPVLGFLPVNNADFDAIRSALTNELMRFVGSATSSSSNAPVVPSLPKSRNP